MALVVRVDDREFNIVATKEDGGYRMQLDGKERMVDILNNEHQNLTLLVDNVPYLVRLNNDGEVFVNNESYTTEVFDEHVRKLLKASPDTSRKKTIAVKALMPGLIVDIYVAEGDAVKKGSGVVIVEAMKMQNEMKSPRDGVVKQVSVKKGQTVNSGDTLIVIE